MCVLIRFNNVISPSLFFFSAFFSYFLFFFFFFSRHLFRSHVRSIKKARDISKFSEKGRDSLAAPAFFSKKRRQRLLFSFFFFPIFFFFSFKYIDYRESLRVTCVWCVMYFFSSSSLRCDQCVYGTYIHT